MITTVEKDKQKIEDTINTLENYKLEALEKTYTKVNKDFAEIFGDLLAGNTCKLQPPEGKTISDGLEVKVCLGGVWKQSLTELSGGQRSLIALSLILSLLQFKPAPMYILDEVDAALDLSHTQNIGSLLRTRFKGSQFLVVSLKDGMFNNANVLFKTRFKDGTSVVEVSFVRILTITELIFYFCREPHHIDKKAQNRLIIEREHVTNAIIVYIIFMYIISAFRILVNKESIGVCVYS